MTINIAIIDKNEIFRESLKILLEQIEGFSVIVDANDCNFLNFSDTIPPIQVLLLDNSFGKEKCTVWMKETLAQWKSVKTLMLATYKEELGFGSMDTEVILKSSGKKEFEYSINKLITG
jgi:DNA-binding NarL/FixJ family response regulator